jgi:putative DNA primase/helicase
MNAHSITKALRGRWHGSYGMCCCPVHDDRSPSMSIKDGDDAVLVKCFSGCDNGDIINALRSLGMIDDAEPRDSYTYRPRHEPKPIEIDPRKAEAVIRLWKECEPIQGTIAETYLRTRGIGIEIPVSLRFHPELKHGPSGQCFPALVAGFQGADRGMNAVHRTFLRPDGSGKADVEQQKMALGCMRGGAVRLGRAVETMGIAEGIETALSAMELFRVPVWAACGSRLSDIVLPPEVKRVVIFADAGAPGIEAAEKAQAVLLEQKRRVAIRYPTIGKDWNDTITARKAANHG